ETFRFQYEYNPIYHQYTDALRVSPAKVNRIEQIPFLPIRFFKSASIQTTLFQPSVIFESSGTTGILPSRHEVKDVQLYEDSFNRAFELFYGKPEDWCIIGLLPSYLERQHSSLVYMVDKLIRQSGHPSGGFYLHEFDKLASVLQQLEQAKQKTLLIGVTFALLDFAEQYPIPLSYTTVMETGGMKGRREELVRPQVHELLKNAFNLSSIHSEYGMTELLSQGYSKSDGMFYSPPWMKILVRDDEDPLAVTSTIGLNKATAGAVNVIDLANLYSCSFIATDDAGRIFPNGGFEVLGRLDNSDLRGCSLLAI
ncbi:MAG: acyl transferase, partial [Chitinophagaceae bacterium]